jgi:chemotaxis protein MotB
MSFTKSLHRKRNRHTEAEEVDTEGTWAVSYGDLITLLLTFFILFFSLDQSPPRPNKMRVAFLDEIKAITEGKSDKPYFDQVKPITPAGAAVRPNLPSEDAAVNKVTFPKEFAPVAYEVDDKVLLEFPGVSFFNSSQVDLTKDGRESLTQFAKLFVPYSGNFFVSIRAFADNRQVLQGVLRFKDNLELSALRSIAAMRVLQSAGIPIDRIRTGGYGELVVTADELARLPASIRPAQGSLALARKVVLVIEPGGNK